MNSQHSELNQQNYKKDATGHNGLGLNSTLYLAYRDVPEIFRKYLFSSNKKKFRVLDFGCGTGLSTKLISKMIIDSGYQIEITGIDLNKENINFAKQNIENANFYQVTKDQKLTFLGKFDLIICNFVLVENKQNDMNEILKSINLLLENSGIALITNCSGKAYKKSNKYFTFNNDFPENEPTGINGKFKDDQPIKVQVFASGDKISSFTFFDFFHSGAAYKNSYKDTGFSLLETHKPVGKSTDNLNWKDELKFSPYKMHVLKKECDLVCNEVNTLKNT